MNELNEKDWKLINAYHDGELGDSERRALEARLSSEPLLEEALRDVSSVSASLGALRPDTQQIPSLQPDMPANQNSRPAQWLIGGAVAAAIALAVAAGPQFFKAPSAFDIHADFAAQSFVVESEDMRVLAAEQNVDAPNLGSANLMAVAVKDMNDGHVTHYAGRNGCRLTYFRGALSPGEQSPSAGMQVAEWSTANNMWHMIVATGMDQDKFTAIAAYLKLTTGQQANEQIMASLAETTANAARCVG